MGEIKIAFAGRGGQGIVTAARNLADAFFKAGYYVAQLQSYGAEVRGGSVIAYVIASEKGIENPFVEDFDIAFNLHDAGVKRWRSLFVNTKYVVRDPDLVKECMGRECFDIKITSIAIQKTGKQIPNVLVLGMIGGLIPQLREYLTQSSSIVLKNIELFEVGEKLGEELSRRIKITGKKLG